MQLLQQFDHPNIVRYLVSLAARPPGQGGRRHMQRVDAALTSPVLAQPCLLQLPCPRTASLTVLPSLCPPFQVAGAPICFMSVKLWLPCTRAAGHRKDGGGAQHFPGVCTWRLHRLASGQVWQLQGGSDQGVHQADLAGPGIPAQVRAKQAVRVAWAVPWPSASPIAFWLYLRGCVAPLIRRGPRHVPPRAARASCTATSRAPTSWWTTPAWSSWRTSGRARSWRTW